jgi:hypothetical protein
MYVQPSDSKDSKQFKQVVKIESFTKKEEEEAEPPAAQLKKESTIARSSFRKS